MVGRLRRDLATLPNRVSLARIGLIVAGPLFYLYGWRAFGLVVCTVAGVTDYLDGYLARRLGQETALGAVLDRLSDLIFETTVLVVIVALKLMSPLVLVAYLWREVVVISVRLYCAEEGAVIGSTIWGKLKTNFLGWSFLLIFLVDAQLLRSAPLEAIARFVGVGGITCGLLFSYISGYQYVRAFVAAYERGGGVS